VNSAEHNTDSVNRLVLFFMVLVLMVLVLMVFVIPSPSGTPAGMQAVERRRKPKPRGLGRGDQINRNYSGWYPFIPAFSLREKGFC
jgi:hypothetical protein